ncbi:biotin/lipoyl-binding protein, partial [Aquicoccus sp. SCR17]|nr:biotin/lipoyl-binding protein [Carideicomes alvinocaridis]
MRMAPRTDFGRGERLLALSGGALLLVLLALFHFIRIDGAVIAAGRATEAGAPVTVQSPGDGLVGAVLVRDGERVAAGDVLLRLDPALLEARRDLLRDRL